MRGRPPKPLGERKIERLDLRLASAEKDLFRLAAGEAGVELSVWVRVHLTEAAKQQLANDKSAGSRRSLPTLSDA